MPTLTTTRTACALALAQVEVDRERRRRRRIRLYQDDPFALAAAAGFTPDPWQAAVLREQAKKTLLLNCARQTGKSTIVALLVTRALLTEDALVVIVAPGERQSKELMRRILRFWRKMGRLIPHTGVSQTSLHLSNGARLEAYPASSETIIGLSAVTLLVAEEASVIPDELYHYVDPMLAVSQGRLIGLSTPKGKRGWWYELWATPPAADADIARFNVRAEDCPRIDPAWLAARRRRMGDWWYQQEYNCVFQDAESSAFRSQDIDAAFSGAVAFDQELFAS